MRTSRSLVYALVLGFASLSLAGCLGGGFARNAATVVVGTFQNEFGNPVRGAAVAVAGVTGRTGSDGSFRLSGVAAGAQTLTVTGTGYQTRRIPVQVAAGKVNRVTEPGGSGNPVVKTFHSLGADPAELNSAGSAAKEATQAHAVCAECHLPHAPGSGNPALLKANDQGLCQRADCHVAPDGGTWEHPASHLDNTLIRPTGELAPYDRIGCLRCHRSHAGSAGTLTPGFPASPTTRSYSDYCAACHNASQPGNQYDPATHNPGYPCLEGCHDRNGLARVPHSGCARPESGCHPASATLPLAAAHRNVAGGCAGCHDLEGTRPNLLKATAGALCGQAGCHAGKTPPQAEHAAAGCDGCHSIHGTAATPDAKCYTSCHATVRAERQAGASTHDVSCATCHHGHVVTAAQRVTNPFTGAAYPYTFLTSGAFCLLCHGLGPDYQGANQWAPGDPLPAPEKWPGALNIVPEFIHFPTRATTFWIGNRFASEGGLDGPWYDAGLNGHYAHWGDEYVPNPPPGWPYVDGAGNPSLPDPCLFCHGVHAGRDPKLVRPISGPHSDWTLYRADHQYDCHYACHAPLSGSAARAAKAFSATSSVRSIESAVAKRAASPVLRTGK